MRHRTSWCINLLLTVFPNAVKCVDEIGASLSSVFFTHVFAPFEMEGDGDSAVEQKLVHESWQRAAHFAQARGIFVEFLACVLPEDVEAVPSFARGAKELTYYATDARAHRLPTIGEIFRRGVEEGRGRYLVYTNIDIGTMEDFYVRSHTLLSQAEEQRESTSPSSSSEPPWMALEYTRVQTAKLGRSPVTLDDILSWSPIGRHPGHDCFVVPRHLVPPMLLTGGLVVGMPPWGTMYHFALQRDPRLKLLFLQGTDKDRYTFHTGTEGGMESWMSNQDFRIQQYAEAMRIFGPVVTSRAWGAKGKHSPFYLMCNATTMRFPVCAFCDAFYPASLYPELSVAFERGPTERTKAGALLRTCRGRVTDRQFYSHLPPPVQTEWSDLEKNPSKEMLQSSSKDSGYGTADRRSKKSPQEQDDEAMNFLAKQFGGRQEPCKVKCIKERTRCGRIATRSPIRAASRPRPPSASAEKKLDARDGKLVRHEAAPMLWTFPGGFGHLWVRLLLEYGLGFFTGSVEAKSNSTAAPAASLTSSFEAAVMKHNEAERQSSPSPSGSVGADDTEHCSNTAMAVHLQPMVVTAPEFFAKESSSSTPNFPNAPYRYAQPAPFSAERVKQQLAPSCLLRGPFRAAVVVLRNPYRSIWAEYHRHWATQRLAEMSAQAEAQTAVKRQRPPQVQKRDETPHASPIEKRKKKKDGKPRNKSDDEVMSQRVQKLAFSFMTDQELERFSVQALKMANFWAAAHADLLRFRDQSNGKSDRGKGGSGLGVVHFLRYEDLEPFQNGGFGEDNLHIKSNAEGLARKQMAAQAAFDGVASFLGLENIDGTTIGRTSKAFSAAAEATGQHGQQNKRYPHNNKKNAQGAGSISAAVVPSERIKCAFELAKRALRRDLTMTQQITSMDQLYEGVTTCKMWAIFGDVATALGYTEPINGMPCLLGTTSHTGNITGHRATRDHSGSAGREVDTCGWFRWALSSPPFPLPAATQNRHAPMSLSAWVDSCMPGKF